MYATKKRKRAVCWSLCYSTVFRTNVKVASGLISGTERDVSGRHLARSEDCHDGSRGGGDVHRFTRQPLCATAVTVHHIKRVTVIPFSPILLTSSWGEKRKETITLSLSVLYEEVSIGDKTKIIFGWWFLKICYLIILISVLWRDRGMGYKGEGGGWGGNKNWYVYYEGAKMNNKGNKYLSCCCWRGLH